MRSQWCWAVAVWLGVFWGMNGVTWAQAPWRQVAQVDTATDTMPVIVAGPQNPQVTVDIDSSVADLSALQVSVTAPPDRTLTIDAITIGFGVPFGEEVTTGNESFLDELHARLIIEDIDVNGLQDDGEVSEGTQSITDLEDPATVVFTLNPSLSLAAGDTATFLVVLDINRPATQAAAATPWNANLTLLVLPIIGLLSYASRAVSNAHRLWVLTLLFGLGIMLAGCASNNKDDELRFVVNLPSNGLTGAGQRLGPENAIAGTTIRLTK